MGYTTDFEGAFSITPPITDTHANYINAFANTRRMKRDATVTEKFPDPLRLAVGLPIGEEAGYYVGASSMMGQENTPDILNYNAPPADQPGLWCQWIVNDFAEPNRSLEWNGGEKFYNYIEWLEYLIQHFLGPWSYQLTGTVTWRGEDHEDVGTIRVSDNVIAIGHVTWTYS